MKKQRFHIFPLETTFLRKIEARVQYQNQHHYMNFHESSLEVTAFNDSPENMYWQIDLLFEKVLKTLGLHNSKYLNKLNLSIQASFVFKTSTIRHLCKRLASQFKTLKQLDLRLLSCKDLNSEKMRYLLDSLTKGMKNLTELNLYFLGCPDIDDRCLKAVKLFVLKRCKRLQKFTLITSGWILDVSGKGFIYFESDIDQRIQIDNTLCELFGWDIPNNISEKGSSSIHRSVARYLKKLKSLNFQMALQQTENGKKLTRDILKMISDLNLQNLTISTRADSLKLDDMFLAKLTSCVGQNLKNLKSLSLDFERHSEITEKGFQHFASNLFMSIPSQLTYFAMNLEDFDSVTDDIVREIGFNIAKHLKNLQTLILCFHYMDQLTGSALQEFTRFLTIGLPSLKKLVLSFHWCQGMKQNFSVILPDQIQQFDLYLYNPQTLVHETWKNLNRLSLSFNECQEKNCFSDLFSKPDLICKDLEELKLLYSQCKNLTNKEIENLASAIGTHLENLTSLELGFSDCPLVTTDSLLYLGDSICGKLKKLRNLNFSFFRAGEDSESSFAEGGIRHLFSLIASKLENLESLTLFFCGSIDEDMSQEEVLDEFCSLVSQKMNKLKKLTLTFDLYEKLELKRKMRARLCRIPVVYLH